MPAVEADTVDFVAYLRGTDRAATDAAERAEQAVLGGCLLDNAAWQQLPAGFRNKLVSEQHRSICRALGELIDEGTPADVVTVYKRLDRYGQAEAIGLPYLEQLQSTVPTAANVAHYAALVVERFEADQVKQQQAEAVHMVREGRFDDARAVLDKIAKPHTGRSSIPLDFRTLAQRRAPPRVWIRQDWLTQGATVVGGLGGIGKSGLIQQEMTNGALGRAYFTPECDPYKSLYWNAEDDEVELWRRQERICDHEQIDMADLADKLFIVSRYGLDNPLMAESHGRLITTPLMRELRDQVNDLGVEVLWLDNAAHFFAGNHDDRTQVTAFINALNGLVVGRPFSVAILVHTARVAGSEFSGSAAWENAARMRWYLSTKPPGRTVADDGETEANDSRFLSRRKSNYSALDSVRMTMQRGLLLPEHAALSHVDQVVRAGEQRRAEEVCIAGFRALKLRGINCTDGKTSGDYLPRHIVEKGLGDGYSAKDLAAAMHRLMGTGVFVRGVIGKYPNRSDKFGLVLQS